MSVEAPRIIGSENLPAVRRIRNVQWAVAVLSTIPLALTAAYESMPGVIVTLIALSALEIGGDIAVLRKQNE